MWKSTISSAPFSFCTEPERMHALSRAGAPVLRCLTSTSRALPLRAMGSSAAGGRDPAENPEVGKLRELLNADGTGEGGVD